MLHAKNTVDRALRTELDLGTCERASLLVPENGLTLLKTFLEAKLVLQFEPCGPFLTLLQIPEVSREMKRRG